MTILFEILDQIVYIPWKQDKFISFIIPCISQMNWSDYYYMLSYHRLTRCLLKVFVI